MTKLRFTRAFNNGEITGNTPPQPLVLGVDLAAGADRSCAVFGRAMPGGKLYIENEVVFDLPPVDVHAEILQAALSKIASATLEWVYEPELSAWVLRPKGRPTSAPERDR